MKGGGRRAEEWMGVKCFLMVPKIRKVGCHLATYRAGGMDSYTWPHPRTARSIEMHLPAPHTTRAGGADQEGHPGRVKARRGGRRTEEKMETRIILIFTTRSK